MSESDYTIKKKPDKRAQGQHTKTFDEGVSFILFVDEPCPAQQANFLFSNIPLLKSFVNRTSPIVEIFYF